jgi:AraC-like DNA-binding protein
MKPQLHKIATDPNSSFVIQEIACNYFDKPWHFHREYEITLITSSEGTRFIGDDVSVFKPKDLIFIGADTPHLFRNNESYYTNMSQSARSLDIHFTEDSFGRDFFLLPEMKDVKKVLDRSKLGFLIKGNAQKHITKKMYEMVKESPAKRLMSLLDILITLSNTSDLKNILTKEFVETNRKEASRIDAVFQYIMNNFKNDIYIEDIASVLHLSVASFSRFFKQHTRKTFSHCVTEIRVSHACQLLMEGQYSVSEIGYMSGFENQSNFFRHFKTQTGLTPKQYRERFLRSANS